MLLLVLAICAGSVVALGQTNTAFAIYDPNPNHLWNRLFVSFYRQTYNVPTNSSEATYWAGPDVLDPPLSLHPRFMLDDARFARCNSVLDEFLDQSGEKLIRDPLKRAMLQRDFWAVFDVLANTFHAPSPFANPFDSTNRPVLSAALEARRVVLARKVAQVIGALALTRAEIEHLPDTYATAVESQRFSTVLDPKRDDVLPDDLFLPGTSWVEIVPAKGEGRMNHSAMISGRSLFRVFVKPPTGKGVETNSFKPRPVGTQFLLLREMVCLDEHWRMTPTHVVESVQYRTSLKTTFSSRVEVRELKMSRARLFRGEAGGLRPIVADELDVTAYGSLGHFNLVDERGNAGWLFALPRRCAGCHGGDQERRQISRGAPAVPRRSVDIDAVIRWREERASLDHLRGFINETKPHDSILQND